MAGHAARLDCILSTPQLAVGEAGMLAVDLINHTAPWVGSPPKLKGYWPELRITYDPELARSLDSAGRATRQKGQCNGRGILPALVEAGPARSRVFALFPPSPRGCWCPPGLHPPNCTLTPLPAKRCIGGCSNAGQCIAGTCVCNAGRSGIDCGRSVHADAAGAIAAQEASARAPSPRIYVYELPAEYTTWLALSPSANDPGAEGMWWQGLDPVYSADLRLLNRLLVSPHRTLDPARADFYYVPMLLSLGFISHRFGIYLPSAPAARVINRTIAHIRSAYPYWNRSDGADHIFMFTGDDGAAWLRGRLPLLEHAIFLTHWGMQCNDRTLRKRGRRHCVTAQIGFRSHHSGQDIVLPPLHKPQTLLPASVSRHAREGDIYSGGVRQRVYLHHANRSDFYLRERPGARGARGDLEALHASKFCLAPHGTGFGMRQFDAIAHGCVPLIVDVRYEDDQGNGGTLEQPLAEVIPWSALSIRITRAQIPDLPRILAAVPPERHAAMRRAAACVWPRLFWMPTATGRRGDAVDRLVAPPASARCGPACTAELDALVPHDAFSTLMWLLRERVSGGHNRVDAASRRERRRRQDAGEDDADLRWERLDDSWAAGPRRLSTAAWITPALSCQRALRVEAEQTGSSRAAISPAI